MDTRDCDRSAKHLLHPPESPFERCSWFYALRREYLFRDQIPEISRFLFPTGDPSPGARGIYSQPWGSVASKYPYAVCQKGPETRLAASPFLQNGSAA